MGREMVPVTSVRSDMAPEALCSENRLEEESSVPGQSPPHPFAGRF